MNHTDCCDFHIKSVHRFCLQNLNTCLNRLIWYVRFLNGSVSSMAIRWLKNQRWTLLINCIFDFNLAIIWQAESRFSSSPSLSSTLHHCYIYICNVDGTHWNFTPKQHKMYDNALILHLNLKPFDSGLFLLLCTYTSECRQSKIIAKKNPQPRRNISILKRAQWDRIHCGPE